MPNSCSCAEGSWIFTSISPSKVTSNHHPITKFFASISGQWNRTSYSSNPICLWNALQSKPHTNPRTRLGISVLKLRRTYLYMGPDTKHKCARRKLDRAAQLGKIAIVTLFVEARVSSRLLKATSICWSTAFGCHIWSSSESPWDEPIIWSRYHRPHLHAPSLLAWWRTHLAKSRAGDLQQRQDFNFWYWSK